VTLPRMLYRVEWLEGFGWPECTRKERTHRTYTNPDDARSMVATIRALPSHHELIGIWQTSTDWIEVPEQLVIAGID